MINESIVNAHSKVTWEAPHLNEILVAVITEGGLNAGEDTLEQS